jgi:hypothetical protein
VKFLGFLVGVYILGVLANGAVIQYLEDPYGCRSSSSNVFFCPWNPDREEDPTQKAVTRRVLLWPAYMVQTFTKLAKDNETDNPYPR